MLKIKDNVDVKELEKFGFKPDEYDLFYGFYQTYNGKSYDVLYDLIKANLVEKVEDK